MAEITQAQILKAIDLLVRQGRAEHTMVCGKPGVRLISKEERMANLLKRLRSTGDRDEGRPYSDMHDAADEIERLRAALKAIADDDNTNAEAAVFALNAIHNR